MHWRNPLPEAHFWGLLGSPGLSRSNAAPGALPHVPIGPHATIAVPQPDAVPVQLTRVPLSPPAMVLSSCRLSFAPFTSAILVCVLPAAAPVPSCCGCCPVPWGQEGLIPFPVSLMVAHGGCGCPAGHGAGHSGTGGSDPAGASWHRERTGVGVPRCPVPLGLSLPPGRGRGRCPQPCRSPPLRRGCPRRPVEGTRRPVCGRAGSEPELGAGSVPVPERGAQGGAGAGGGAAARGGDGPCRSRCVGRNRAVAVPVRGAVPVPVRGAGPCGAVAGVRGGAVPVSLRRCRCVGWSCVVPVPIRGAGTSCAVVGAWGGDERCRCRYPEPCRCRSHAGAGPPCPMSR